MMIKASVAMPVYNSAPYLKEALDSIFAQTFTDFEVIAVDDRSSDNSLEVLRSFNDPRLKVVPLEQNLGHPGATQTAFDLAQGQYILRCDADDINHPERFARQIAFMDAHPQIGVSGCALELFGESTGIRQHPTQDHACRSRMLFSSPVPDCACIIRRELLTTHRIGYGPDAPRTGGDWLFMLDLAGVSGLANIDDVLLQYRRGEQNISGRGRSQDIRRNVVRTVLQRFGLEGTAREVDLHQACIHILDECPPGLVQEVHAFLRRMEEVNKDRDICPPETFRKEVRWWWDRFFFSVANAGWRSAWAYIRLNGGLSPERWSYLAKKRLATVLGRNK